MQRTRRSGRGLTQKHTPQSARHGTRSGQAGCILRHIANPPIRPKCATTASVPVPQHPGQKPPSTRADYPNVNAPLHMVRHGAVAPPQLRRRCSMAALQSGHKSRQRRYAMFARQDSLRKEPSCGGAPGAARSMRSAPAAAYKRWTDGHTAADMSHSP